MNLSKFLSLKGSAPSKIDEAAYELVALELANNSVKQGLWTKALADSEWDDAKAKSCYVKMRHHQLIDEINNHSKEKDYKNKKVEIARAEALDYGLSHEEIDYLGSPIMAIRYVEKYRKTKDQIINAIAMKKLSAVMKGDVLWVSDKSI